MIRNGREIDEPLRGGGVHLSSAGFQSLGMRPLLRKLFCTSSAKCQRCSSAFELALITIRLGITVGRGPVEHAHAAVGGEFVHGAGIGHVGKARKVNTEVDGAGNTRCGGPELGLIGKSEQDGARGRRRFPYRPAQVCRRASGGAGSET